MEKTEASSGVRDSRLRGLLEGHWSWLMARAPTWATRMGDHRYDAELGAFGPEAVRRDRVEAQRWLAEAARIERRDLSREDALTLQLFVDMVAGDAATDLCHTEQWDVSARTNPLATANDLPDVQPIRRVTDGRNLVGRYRGIPAMVMGAIALSREGIAAGRTPERGAVALVLRQVHDELALPSAEMALAGPAHESHPEWSAADLAAFRRDLGAAIEEAREAFSTYETFLRDELLPAARPPEQAGTLFLPDGAACYAALIHKETGLPLTARALHATGLSELERIHAEVRGLGASLCGTDDPATIFSRLREDPSLRFSTRDDVLAAASRYLEAARAAVPRYFGRLPAADCVVRPIPDYLAPYTYIAYYNPAVPGGEQPGEYRVNTWQPETRARFELAALTFHESIPGHHLQMALAQELPDLPSFRRNLGPNVYIEGWALYTERLAVEMGLYRDDLDTMGMLGFDAWRASRLVVDTGIHAQGWTREQAVAFMMANTPLAENNIRNEVDRYITWPGQALSYKTGQLEILRLRAEAEAALGPRFSLPAFHDVVLGAGAVSLPVLGARVHEWIATLVGSSAGSSAGGADAGGAR